MLASFFNPRGWHMVLTNKVFRKIIVKLQYMQLGLLAAQFRRVTTKELLWNQTLVKATLEHAWKSQSMVCSIVFRTAYLYHINWKEHFNAIVWVKLWHYIVCQNLWNHPPHRMAVFQFEANWAIGDRLSSQPLENWFVCVSKKSMITYYKHTIICSIRIILRKPWVTLTFNRFERFKWRFYASNSPKAVPSLKVRVDKEND